MQIGDLYQFILVIVLIGMVLGVGILAIDRFSSASGVTSAASSSLNATRTELGNISTNWLGLIITIAVLAIVLGLVVRSFSMGGNR